MIGKRPTTFGYILKAFMWTSLTFVTLRVIVSSREGLRTNFGYLRCNLHWYFKFALVFQILHWYYMEIVLLQFSPLSESSNLIECIIKTMEDSFLIFNGSSWTLTLLFSKRFDVLCYLFSVVDHCFGSPCRNNGTCHNAVNDYNCTCSAGYSGKSCEG